MLVVAKIAPPYAAELLVNVELEALSVAEDDIEIAPPCAPSNVTPISQTIFDECVKHGGVMVKDAVANLDVFVEESTNNCCVDAEEITPQLILAAGTRGDKV